MITAVAIASFCVGGIAGVLVLRGWQRRKLIQLTPRMNLLEARYEMLKHATRRPCVVMLGDSLTAGVPWSELTECSGVANYGWNGDTSSGVLFRLNEIILLRPRAVFMMVGANDILKGTPAAETARNVRDIVDRLTNEGIAVVVHPVVPFVDAGDRLVRTNRAIVSALAGTAAEIVPVPIWLDDLRDGLHLGPSGAAKWHDTIRPMIAGHCRCHHGAVAAISA